MRYVREYCRGTAKNGTEEIRVLAVDSDVSVLIYNLTGILKRSFW